MRAAPPVFSLSNTILSRDCAVGNASLPSVTLPPDIASRPRRYRESPGPRMDGPGLFSFRSGALIERQNPILVIAKHKDPDRR
jgi:hypothetical protein